MNKSKFLFPLLTSIIAGLLVAVFAMAFTGPGTRSPGTGNPDYWIKSGYDVYYNITGGNVGIGTAGPGTKLDVSGRIRSTEFQLGTSATAGYVLTTDASGVGTWQAVSALPSGTTGQTLRYTGSVWQANSIIYNNGTNVGIGTAGPGALLDVQGAAQFGSGNVNLIDSTGKIAGISSTYFASLNGSALTSLNASNLGSGTVSSARISGSYTGITGVGTLIAGTWNASVITDAYIASAATWNAKAPTASPTFTGDVTMPGTGIWNSSGNVGIGTTDPGTNRLKISGGNLDLSGNSITGVDKISVNTIDPVFDINGKKYATYVPDVAGGVSVHTYGKAALQELNSQFRFVIDFNAVEENSNLWLFAKTTDFGSKMENLVVSLTPEGQRANLYYQLDASKNQLIIYGDKPVTLSYSLSAPRIDHQKWSNLSEDQLLEGIDISEFQNK